MSLEKKNLPNYSSWLDLPQKRDVVISMVIPSKINIQSKCKHMYSSIKYIMCGFELHRCVFSDVVEIGAEEGKGLFKSGSEYIPGSPCYSSLS